MGRPAVLLGCIGLSAAIFGCVGGASHGAVLTRATLPHIRAELGLSCPRGGYDLRATPDRCPECGTIADKA
jgi:hypothetical protein